MRELRLDDPALVGRSLVVSAGAGSGKTFALSVLVTGSLGRGALRAHEVLASTFSEAAAADLRERLLRPLDLLASLDAAAWKELLPMLADGLGLEAWLGARALPERLAKAKAELALAARLWPEPDGARPTWMDSASAALHFWRRTRREAELLRVSTLHGLALALLRQGGAAPSRLLESGHPAMLRLLRRAGREGLLRPEGHPDGAAAETLLRWAEGHWEALSRHHDGHRDAMGRLGTADAAPHRAAAEACFQDLARSTAPFLHEGAEPYRLNKSDGRPKGDATRFRALGAAPADWRGRIRWCGELAEAAFTLDKHGNEWRMSDRTYTTAFIEALEPLWELASAWEGWLGTLLEGVLLRFEGLKAERGIQSFGDLVREALAGLQQGTIQVSPPGLLVVDEYQDTSPAQDAFLRALGARSSILVGDLKQAIYGFRGGDPELLAARLRAAGENAFRLGTNYRSAPPIVELANTFVGRLWPLLDPEAVDPGGVQVAARTGAWPVTLVREELEQGRDLPGLAPVIAALGTEAGWTEQAGPAEPRPGRRRALLLRQRTHLPRLLLALKAAGIQPYVLAQDGFWDSPGVRLLMAALEAVAHSQRALPCAALLRQVAGLEDPELGALALAGPGLPGLGELDPDRLPVARRPAGRFLCTLRGATPQELAAKLLAEGSLLAQVAALEAHGALEPARARRNLEGLLSLLLELPSSPAGAFAALDELREGLQRGDLPAPAAGADLVVQTIHASKGLEYEDLVLPLLQWAPGPFRKGQLGTRPGTGALAFPWKLGPLQGQAYRDLREEDRRRQRRDGLNLLYVALTRARERLALICIPPEKPAELPEAKTWADIALHLEQAHPALAAHPGARGHRPTVRPPEPQLQPPPGPAPPLPLPPLLEGEALDPAERARRQRDGEAMHAFLQDLLLRWEDPDAFARCLAKPPAIPGAADLASRFLAGMEARGLRHLPRRTEMRLAGAAASGATGRADLVVWEPDRVGPARIHLVDYKHSVAFGPAELAGYREQLRRYAAALGHPAIPVRAWLAALKSGEWVELDLG